MDGLPSRTSHPLLQRTAKPSSVLTRACAYASNGHFSRLMVTHQLKHATRFQTHEPRALAASFDDSSGNCLRLHEVGFALPRVSPLERCALTAPFHPYRAKYRSAQRGGLFSVALSLTRSQGPVGITHHHCPTVLGLSSRRRIGERLSDTGCTVA